MVAKFRRFSASYMHAWARTAVRMNAAAEAPVFTLGSFDLVLIHIIVHALIPLRDFALARELDRVQRVVARDLRNAGW